MVGTGIEDRIERALAGRSSQRDFVGELGSTWTTLTEGFEELIAVMEAADRSSRDNGQTGGQVRVQEAVAATLRGEPGGTQSAAGRLRVRIDEARRQTEAVCARVGRETVNIGVIGSTKAGKSTLLRTITGLPDSVIPSSDYNPTTAAPSRIYHVAGQPSASLHMHTWESFRDSYLAPLHGLAQAGPVPQTPNAFVQHHYPSIGSDDAGGAAADRYLRKLVIAQASFASYEHLLRGPATRAVDLADLRPFVAYPLDGDQADHRPYHAVRDTEIFQQFPKLAAIKLGLIDLPGAGEAGLDVDRQFLQGLKNEIDVLLMVKRPTAVNAAFLEEDSYALELADSARSGVPLDDFYRIVINRDQTHVRDQRLVTNTFEEISKEARYRTIPVVVSDVVQEEEVLHNLMAPTLEHLALRLAEMDRAVVGAALDVTGQVAREVSGFVESVLQRMGNWERDLPDQDADFRDRALTLRNDIAKDLLSLRDQYDSAMAAGAADPALEAGITAAVTEASDWVSNGLGHGNRAQWLEDMRGAFAAGPLEAQQDEYYRAREKITGIFGAIDVSFDDSVRRLWDDVARVLRGRLTEKLVPDAPDALVTLENLADQRRAWICLHGAVSQLRQLEIGYGRILLRVTRPIIRKITWEESSVRQSGSQASGTLRTVAKDMIDTAGMSAVGLPVASMVSAARNASGEWCEWWESESGSAAPTTPTTQVPATQGTVSTPVAEGGEVAKAASGAERLYDELTVAVQQRISELDSALRREARVMASVLAAAVDQFFETAIRTNNSERDYEKLARPSQQLIWPDLFGGGVVQLAAELSRIEENARAVLSAAGKVSDLGSARRLRPVSA